MTVSLCMLYAGGLCTYSAVCVGQNVSTILFRVRQGKIKSKKAGIACIKNYLDTVVIKTGLADTRARRGIL